jgi:hypothetical protein
MADAVIDNAILQLAVRRARSTTGSSSGTESRTRSWTGVVSRRISCRSRRASVAATSCRSRPSGPRIGSRKTARSTKSASELVSGAAADGRA